MEFKDLVKNRRLELHLTMEELAARAGVSKATIQRYESGEIKNVRRDKIATLATALNTTTSYLMGWEEEPDNKYKVPKFFTDAQSAMKFIIEQPMVAAYGGYDLDKMSEEEVIDFANTVLQLMKVAASQIKR